jgi:SSS family solute:Na+ symporter
VLAASNRDVLKRNMSALPIYSLALGLIALLGYMAIAAGTKPIGTDGNTIVPVLFQQMFPSWFAGIAFAAIGIGALVPAAIMSIAAANLFTRNVYKEYLKKDATPQQEAKVAKIASLVVKLGAVLAILGLNPQFSIDLQLIGGVIILQTLPSVALGLYTRWFHRGGLIAGWVAGMVTGLLLVYNIPKLNPDGTVAREHFGGSSFALSKFGFDTKSAVYAGFLALLVNLIVAIVVTLILRAMKVDEGVDGTAESDYTAAREDPTVRDLPDPLASAPPGAGGEVRGRT